MVQKNGTNLSGKDLLAAYQECRSLTEELSAPLSAEDQTVQSMPDASPTKWHRGHTSWFFETLVLAAEFSNYKVYEPSYMYLFNSYYESLGARYPRSERGLITRPSAKEIGKYRQYVDGAMIDFFESSLTDENKKIIELGIQHEQQHQELLLMDIKHALSLNPMSPSYLCANAVEPSSSDKNEIPVTTQWIESEGGLVEIGSEGDEFSFDNERPRHSVHLVPFALSNRLVSCGDWIEFIQDGGYRRPELWLSDGWAEINERKLEAPLYWSRPDRRGVSLDSLDSEWEIFTLSGQRKLNRSTPVCHVSYFEADAFARWAGCRLPTEAEWETTASQYPLTGNFLDQSRLDPSPYSPSFGFFGDVWQWTSSSYCPYPKFQPAKGALGEYNGKFMVNQYVLRGGSCVTPRGHIRRTYRNFFPAGARWAFAGVRLARDL